MNPTDWTTLFKKRGGLTSKQVEVLSMLCSQDRTIPDIAFLIGSTPSGAARVVNALTKRGLAYYDLVGVGSDYLVRVSPEGAAWATKNNLPDAPAPVLTWGLKIGTQPAGAVEDPSPIAVGEVRWYRSKDHWRERNGVGHLHVREVIGGERVVVTRVIPGHVSVDYP